jgi:hypothetical protein
MGGGGTGGASPPFFVLASLARMVVLIMHCLAAQGTMCYLPLV